MTPEPLKPCPFCGACNEDLYCDGHYIRCDVCNTTGPSVYPIPDGDAAIAAWNNRAEPLGNSEELPLWMKEIITEKLMPGSRPWNYETRVIMDTLEWVLSLKKPEKKP